MHDPEIYLERYDVTDGSSVRSQDGRYRDVLVLRVSKTAELLFFP